jgi:hypothetical protein
MRQKREAKPGSRLPGYSWAEGRATRVVHWHNVIALPAGRVYECALERHLDRQELPEMVAAFIDHKHLLST